MGSKKIKDRFFLYNYLICSLLVKVSSVMNFLNKLKFLLLSFVVTLKTKKVLCDCGGSVKAKLREGEPHYTSVMVYSRDGSEEGRHYEHRLDNSWAFITFNNFLISQKCYEIYFI